MKIGFVGLLALLFIALKLGNVIAWSWAIVTLPLWGPVALCLAIAIFAAFIGKGAALKSWLENL